MKFTDNQLAAIVFTIIILTISLYHVNNQLHQQKGITYSVEYPQIVIYVNIIILVLCFVSVIGLVKLLQRVSSR